MAAERMPPVRLIFGANLSYMFLGFGVSLVYVLRDTLFTFVFQFDGSDQVAISLVQRYDNFYRII
jgi:hypothetical protein